jgi:hypothetical protein
MHTSDPPIKTNMQNVLTNISETRFKLNYVDGSGVSHVLVKITFGITCPY